jgi:hypothetical protein
MEKMLKVGMHDCFRTSNIIKSFMEQYPYFVTVIGLRWLLTMVGIPSTQNIARDRGFDSDDSGYCPYECDRVCVGVSETVIYLLFVFLVTYVILICRNMCCRLYHLRSVAFVPCTNDEATETPMDAI